MKTDIISSCVSPECRRRRFLHAIAGFLAFALFAIAPSHLLAQSAEDEVPVEDEASQQVEETEEAYRRRMELEAGGDQSDVIIDSAAGNVKAPEGMAALPIESRKHLRDQLRGVIIEEGEWSPEDAQKTYPYTPSEAAQKDTKLRQLEEAAWGELVQEYHGREAAALAAGGGRSGTSPGSGPNGTGAGQGGSSGGQQSSSPGQRGQAGAPPAREAAADAASTAAGAGVSQSALEFLKGKQSGNAPGSATGPGQAGDNASAGAQGNGNAAATSQAAAPDSQTGQGKSDSQGQESKRGQEQSPEEPARPADPAESQPESKPAESQPQPPPGSLAIGELSALEAGQVSSTSNEENSSKESSSQTESSTGASSSSGEESSDTTESDSTAPPPPPGTIAIPELEKLQGIEPEEETDG